MSLLIGFLALTGAVVWLVLIAMLIYIWMEE
jgi:hypothetical protein